MKTRSLLLLLFSGLILMSVILWQKFDNSSQQIKSEIDHPKAQNILDAFLYNFEITKDLELGYPPVERLIPALEHTRQLQEQYANAFSRGDLTAPRWRERGPNNIGGRTRAIIVDQNDPTGNTVFAGGVAGGLWKTTNMDDPNTTWEKINDFLDNLSVGALAQDPTNPQIIYMGTGEGFNNLDAVPGLGIFRSTDGGDTWELLNSTLVGDQFRYTRALLIDPNNGDVYAGTDTGLYRSKNQGETWVKVFGAAIQENGNIYDLAYGSNGSFFVSNRFSIWRSPSGDLNSWTQITKSPVPGGLQRVEFALCPQDENIVYLIGNQGGGASNVFRTLDGGDFWQIMARPNNGNGSEFTNGQAWYDLEIIVDPTNCEHVIAGGVPIRRSLDGGLNWSPFGGSVHVDQHKFLFDPNDPRKFYMGNDGGVYRAVFNDNGIIDFEDKNNNYNVTQYYHVAMHPDTFSNYFLGGTQDNGSQNLNEIDVTSARVVWGGDGIYCHIDQDEPNIQLVSSQYANYGISFDGGASFGSGQSWDGGFINVSDYDNDANILYAQTNTGDFFRWNINTGQAETIDIVGENINVSAVFCDPNVPNRVYFGTFSPSRIIRVDDAHEGSSVEGEVLTIVSGTASHIDVELGNPDHILVTLSNFGLSNNIWETKNGGENWVGQEGVGLPDVPVRAGLFNPNDASQAMIATELGVWTTELLDGNNTVWIPPMPSEGIPLVTTWDLQIRPSDKVVLAGTHGRGMFSTDVFSPPTPRMEYQQVGYINQPVEFNGANSLNADDYSWELGDGTTSSERNFTHTFDEIGTYSVTLSINDGALQTTGKIKILPERPTPYEPGAGNYSGSFEGASEEDWGVYTISGSSFERGSSTIQYKDGAKTGDNAFVVGLNEIMQDETHTILYLPNFDLSESGIYEFSFWAKYDLETGNDGFRLEYSKDGGRTWKHAGANVSENWYNTENTALPQGAFPIGSRYWSKLVSDWVNYKLNISNLAGEGNVAFRFVCRGNGSGPDSGLVLDDVTITRFEGALETRLLTWEGGYSGNSEITLEWSTQPEYNCVRFEVERSENGKDYEVIEEVDATGKTTQDPQQYELSVFGQRNLYFFRLKVINEDTTSGYNYEFYSPILTVRRQIEGVNTYKVFPNPFTNEINVSFTDVVDQPIRYELYNAAGQLITKGEQVTEEGTTFLNVQVPTVSAGVYFLSIWIGNNDPETVKLMGGL
jgi:PKD repeat protein